MLKIETGSRPNVRVDLKPMPEGADPETHPHIMFKPLTTAGRAAARASIAPMALAVGQEDADGKLSYSAEDSAALGVGVTIGVAMWGALSWVGVGDAAGQPLAVTPDNVRALLEQNEACYDAVEAQYVRPHLAREAEKNASGRSRDGTSRAPRKTSRKGKGRGAGASTAKPASVVTSKPAATKPSARKPSSPKPSGG